MFNWTIGKKVAAGFLLVLLEALSVGIYSAWMTANTSNRLKLISAEYLPETELAAQFEREILNARIHFIYFVTVQKQGSLEKGWQRFQEAERQLPRLQEVIARSETFAAIRPEVAQLRRDFDSYKPVLERIVGVVQRGQNHGPEFADLLNQWARLGGAMVDSAGNLNRHGIQAADASARQASSRGATTTLAGACLICLLVGIALTAFVTRDIARALRAVITELGEVAQQIAGRASQIAGSAESLSQGAAEQAASLEQTAASSEEINSMARRNAENSACAATAMVQAADRIEAANRELDQMAGAMDDINASSDRISKIIKVIDEIAFQTNILALNAAVEAARAGEAGMGFAVVADEVRGLAQRCAQAAHDTAGIIEESMAKSSDGKAKLNRVATAIHSVTESASQAKAQVDSVKLASDEQARGFEQIGKAIAQMETVTQATAANAEESASAAGEVNAQSEALRGVVLRMNTMVGGAAS